MPILSNFPCGGSVNTGISLLPVTNIQTLSASGKIYIKWTDPDDIVASDTTIASWAGTLLVRKAGSVPNNRRDGVLVLDSKVKNQYQNEYYCDSGLTDGVTYYYKFFPYSDTYTYTNSTENEFNSTPTKQVEGIEQWCVTGMSVYDEAGNGKIAIKWTDPSMSINSNEVTLATWGSTTVVLKESGYATDIEEDGIIYTFKSMTRNQYASTPLIISGLTNGTTYYISFFPETVDGGINNSNTQRITATANRITIDEVPLQSGALTYTGEVQSPSWENYNVSYMTASGETSGINAGNYETCFTPLTDYRWSDGTIEGKIVIWSIGKASGSMDVSSMSVILNAENLSVDITVTRLGDGIISAVSNDLSIVSVSVNGNIVTVSNVNQTSGSTSIVISCAEGTNHTAPQIQTVSVNAQFISYALKDCDWDMISNISTQGQGANYWSVGDTKSILLNGTIGNTSIFNSYEVFILGFNHNSDVEGFGRIHFSFRGMNMPCCFVDNFYETAGSSTAFRMNTQASNSSGWISSYMRTNICGTSLTNYSGTMIGALPTDLRAVLKSVTKCTVIMAGIGAFSPSTTTDYIFLLSEYEVYGQIINSVSLEQNHQQQYDYYASGNSKIRAKHNSALTSAKWWLRSIEFNLTSTTNFVYVDTDGESSVYSADYSLGFAPCFCV